MRCPRCQADNPAGARFCQGCSAPFPAACPACGADNPAESRFCGQCGAALEGPLAPARPVGELKQVTVLFCDIVNSTRLAERLGPEAMHELVRSFIDRALDEVHRYGGTAPQFLGDGFMALFGAPLAHEDHVQRGLLAALAIRRAVGADTEHPLENAPAVNLRIGVHTGVVVFGAIGARLRMDPTAIGDTANLAARLQGAAHPGSIVISDATYRLAQGFARAEPIGLLDLKGKAEPVQAYRLVDCSDHRTALEVAAASRVRDFVGRDRELAMLRDLAGEAEQGRGRAVALIGEPGIGKSRLLAEFRRRLGDVDWIEGRCLSYGTATPYLLVLDLLRSYCGIDQADKPAAVAEKVRCGLERLGMEDGALLLHLLGLQDLGGSFAGGSPETQKAETFRVLRRVLTAAARRPPLVVAVEDLHWVDRISEEFLASLVDALAGAGILLVATYRPDYRPPWSDACEIALPPLSAEDSRRVVHSVLGAGTGAEALAAAIVAKGDGNPLFLEQLALHAGEHDQPQIAGSVPNTIHDVVMARIDRLPEATKRLLQIAAVIGREFSFRLIAAVWPGRDPIEPHLRELTRLEFIDEQPGRERPTYAFHHALTQETAYASMLERYRRAWHATVGRAIESLYEGHAEQVAERLALHFGRSDDAEKAVDYGILAGEKSQRRWANNEALSYFDEALRRLAAMPDSDANRLRRIDAVLKQAEVKYALGRYAEQIASLERIRPLIDGSDDPRRRATWNYWLGFLHATSGGRPDVAIEYCREASRIASASGLDEIHAFAQSCLAQVYMVAGRQRDAIAAGERALASFEARGDRWWAGRTLWHVSSAANYLGDWQASLDYCRRGLEHGVALEDLRLKVVSWTRMGSAYIQAGEVERGLQCCDEALALSPIPRDAAWARAVRGYGRIRAGQAADGIAELSAALAWFEGSQMRWTGLICACWLAEGHLRQGDRASARALIDHVLTTSRATGYLQYEGRACWLLGECLAAEAPAAAEDHVESAMRIFERIGARNDLARAMVTRAALRRNAGDTLTSRRLLDEAYAIFSALGTRDEKARTAAAFAALRQPMPAGN